MPLFTEIRFLKFPYPIVNLQVKSFKRSIAQSLMGIFIKFGGTWNLDSHWQVQRFTGKAAVKANNI